MKKKKPLRRLTDPEFFNVLAEAPPFEMVIKSASVLEGELEELFRLAFVNVAAIHAMGLTFEQKINLALAIGLSSQFGPPMRTLATVRNVFAHEADVVFAKDHADNLFASLSKEDRKIVTTHYAVMKGDPRVTFETVSPEDRFVLCIIALRAAVQAAQKKLEAISPT